MSVETPQPNEVFTIRIYKSILGYGWANTYEVQTLDPPVALNGLTQAAAAIVNAERQFHFTDVRFDKAVISTYVPDSTVYNPQSFTTINFALYGMRTTGSSYLPLTACVFARFNASTGRSGKRFYRGCLNENDTDGVLVAHFISQAVRDAIQNALSTLVGEFVPGVRMVLARGRPAPTNVRVVESISIAQLSSNKKLNNRYFDVRDRNRSGGGF